MPVRVNLDPRQFLSTSNFAKGLPKVGIMKPLLCSTGASLTAFSKNWPSGLLGRPMGRNIRLCVCPSVRLNVFLSPLPEVVCPKNLEIQNHLGKVMEIRV